MKITYYLIRHCQSEYNVDRDIRLTKLDHEISLTDEGIYQSKEIGKYLNNNLNDPNTKNVMIWSPFNRTRQTAENIRSVFSANFYNEDPIICEQRTPTFYGKKEKLEYDEIISKSKTNLFWLKCNSEYESGFEVYTRANIFFNKLTFYKESIFEKYGDSVNINFLIISHGFFIRTLLMRISNMLPEEFCELKNPKHGEIIKIDSPSSTKYEYFSVLK